MSASRPITRDMLEALAGQARATPRRRKNLNFHTADEAPAQRLLNALEPESYVRPHRHLHPDKDETFVVLRGRIGVLLFDEQGHVTERHVLAPGGATLGITIPAGAFHTILALEIGSVVFEAKAGPYVGNQDNEFAAFAPPEGDARCLAILRTWHAMLAEPAPAGRGSS